MQGTWIHPQHARTSPVQICPSQRQRHRRSHRTSIKTMSHPRAKSSQNQTEHQHNNIRKEWRRPAIQSSLPQARPRSRQLPIVPLRIHRNRIRWSGYGEDWHCIGIIKNRLFLSLKLFFTENTVSMFSQNRWRHSRFSSLVFDRQKNSNLKPPKGKARPLGSRSQNQALWLVESLVSCGNPAIWSVENRCRQHHPRLIFHQLKAIHNTTKYAPYLKWSQQEKPKWKSVVLDW